MHKVTKIITFLKSRWWNIRASEMGYFCIWTIRSIYIGAQSHTYLVCIADSKMELRHLLQMAGENNWF